MSTQIGTSRAGRMSKDKHAKSTAASTAPAQTPSQTKAEKSAPKNQVSTLAHSQTISWRRNGHPVLRINVKFTETRSVLVCTPIQDRNKHAKDRLVFWWSLPPVGQTLIWGGGGWDVLNWNLGLVCPGFVHKMTSEPLSLLLTFHYTHVTYVYVHSIIQMHIVVYTLNNCNGVEWSKDKTCLLYTSDAADES